MLFQALAAVARHDGVSELCFEVLPENETVVQIMRALGIDVHTVEDMIEARLRVEDLPAGDHDGLLVAVMQEVRK